MTIKQVFESLAPISSGEWSVIETLFEFKQIKKHDYFLQEGQVAKQVGFINEGVMRAFSIKDGVDYTITLYNKREFATHYGSFITQTPSIYFIEAIQDTELTILSYENLQRLYNEIPSGNLIGRKIAEQLFVSTMNRVLSLQMDSAKERYEKLIRTKPYIFQVIPQAMIATYLGITPVHLSRLRASTKL